MPIELTEDLAELKAQAEGSKPFKVQPLYERLAEKDLTEFRKFDPTTRLAIGFYVAAKRRAEALATLDV
jgi:hypothetical protein